LKGSLLQTLKSLIGNRRVFEKAGPIREVHKRRRLSWRWNITCTVHRPSPAMMKKHTLQ